MATTATLITAARVWDGVAASPVQNGFVLVENGAIAAVGRQVEIGSALDGARVLDLPGATVLPGLINTHEHLTFDASLTVVPNYLREAAEGTASLTVRAVGNLQAAARVGVTTVRDLGTVDEVAFGVRAAVADGRILGPQVLTSGRPITVTGGHCHWFSHHADTVDEVRRAIRSAVRDGADCIKIFASGGNLTPRTNPFAPQYADVELGACVAEARRLGMPVTAHAHSPAAIARAVAAGVNSIEHASFETAEGVEFDPRTADTMAAAGIAFCPTWGDSFRRLANDPAVLAIPTARRFLSRVPDMGKAMRQLLDAGVPLLAGSDAGVTLRPFDDYPADVAALVGEDGLALNPLQALRAATSEAAELLGLPDTGVLAVGRRADLLAVDGDPLTEITDLVRTRLVFLDGRQVPLVAA